MCQQEGKVCLLHFLCGSESTEMSLFRNMVCFNHRATILVMGGGEGVGSLSHIVNCVYVELVLNGMDALILLVVCGRNDKLKTSLDTRDWGEVLRAHSHMKTSKSTGALMYCNPISPTIGCIDGGVTKSLRKILHRINYCFNSVFFLNLCKSCSPPLMHKVVSLERCQA